MVMVGRPKMCRLSMIVMTITLVVLGCTLLHLSHLQDLDYQLPSHTSFVTIEDVGKLMADSALDSSTVNSKPNLLSRPCVTGEPCVYDDDVDLRIIVMTYNRAESVSKCLQSLQDLELDGDTASLEIWVDRCKNNATHNETLQAVNSFKWNKGITRVHVQTKHAWIYGQWIDTWRPRNDTHELVIFLEDDIDLSPYAYRWLKEAVMRYGHYPNIAGYGLSEIQHYNAGMRKNPKDLVYLYRRIGTHGFAPSPMHWRGFQDWFHEKSADPSFRPYVEKDAVFTNWYKAFEKKHTEQGMWSMWMIRYCREEMLDTLYANIAAHALSNNLPYGKDVHFAYHRREKGLHFSEHSSHDSTGKVITEWHDYFIQFPSKVPLYFYDGTKIDTIEIPSNF